MKPAMGIEAMRAHAGTVAAILKVLAHPDRLLILCRLSEGEAPVGELVEVTGIRQSLVSQHLAILRAAGAVAARAEQQSRYYSIASPLVAQIFDSLCATCGATLIKAA